jgi:general secretion pathway protein A
VHLFGFRDVVTTLTASWARMRRIPYVLEPLGMFKPRLRKVVAKKAFDATVVRGIASGAAAIVVSSSLERDDVVASGAPAARVVVRGNGFPEPLEREPDGSLRRRLGIPQASPLVLYVGRRERGGFILITGEVGTGKTTLLYSLLRTIGDGMRTAFVSSAGLGFDGLLRLALADFGVTSPSPSRFDSLATLNAMLRECASHGRTALLIVDEAQHLTDEDFEQLRLLTNFETFTEKLLQIVLVGQPELEARLRDPGLRALAERVAVHCRLAPLDDSESRAYLDYRLLRVGGSIRLFDRAARDLVLGAAQGLPPGNAGITTRSETPADHLRFLPACDHGAGLERFVR